MTRLRVLLLGAAAASVAATAGTDLLEAIYSRRLAGFVTPKENTVPEGCSSNDTKFLEWYDALFTASPELEAEWNRESQSVFPSDFEDDSEPMAPPPHHPPHHPHPHPHKTLEEDEDDSEPMAPPPHHPPHHPHPHPHKTLEDDEDDSEPMAPPPHHPPHHPHPHPHKTQEDDSDNATAPNSCCFVDSYGELTPAAVETIASSLNLTSNPTAHFFDLGSGVGKICMHMAAQGYAKVATGIELNARRHDQAVNVANEALPAEMVSAAKVDEVPSCSAHVESSGMGKVRLLQGDMLKADLSQATVIYMNQACLPEDVRASLVEKIIRECPAVETVLAAPSLDELVASGQFTKQTFGSRRYLKLDMSLHEDYYTGVAVYKRNSVISQGPAATGVTV